jgi:propanediol utilization protein
MHAILQSVVGRPGPLIVEHKGDMIIEKCMIITNKHVKNINEKIEKLKFSKIEQTTDRSFLLI